VLPSKRLRRVRQLIADEVKVFEKSENADVRDDAGD
jgi:hypothetical protein